MSRKQYALLALLGLSLLLLASAMPALVEATRYGYLGKSGGYDRVAGPSVYYIKIEGMIDSAMEDYVKNSIKLAERDRAPLVILLDTPGGLLESARNIVLAIDESRVPVIGFVYRGWALSAGTLILVSTHIAAMAPGTQIGSLQPVMYDPMSGTYKPVNESKIINPILEFLDEHAASKGRNKTQLHRFVTHNDNLGPSEALKKHVIDFIAPSLESLIAKINGSRVRLLDGSVVLLRLDGSYRYLQPSIRVLILHVLSDPILSGVLLSLGMLIILFTLASGHPGIAPIGALLLLLGLAGTGFSPNYTALFLLLLGATLLFIELYTPGFGIVGGTGIVMLVLGIALMPVSTGGMSLSIQYAKSILRALYATGGLLGAVGAFTVYKVIKARRRPPVMWTIIGARGRAIDRIEPGRPGFVIVEGEYWKAVSDEVIERGDEIIVVGKEGAILRVRKARE